MLHGGPSNQNSVWFHQIYSEFGLMTPNSRLLQFRLQTTYFWQPRITVNIPKDHMSFYFFIHNKDQMYIPKFDGAFGSYYFYKILLGSNYSPCNNSCHQSYLLTRTRRKTLNTPGQRCDEGNGAPSTTQCITRYLEQKIGCSMGLRGTNPKLKR